MLTLEILNALKAHIAHNITDLSVELFFKNLAEYHLSHQNGAVLIRYPSSSYAPSQEAGLVCQERTINFQFVLLVSGVHGVDKAIVWFDRLKSCLQGWLAPHCGKIHLSQESALGEITGVYQFMLEAAAKSMSIQTIDTEDQNA